MNNKDENKKNDLYNKLIFHDVEDNKDFKSNFWSNEKIDCDFDNNNTSDFKLFTFDDDVNNLRNLRLNEKDKFYKFKKHYFLKDSYNKLLSEENLKYEEELYYETVYLKNCFLSEKKLEKDLKLDHLDIYYLSKRNFPLLIKADKAEINFYSQLHYSFKIAALMGTIVLTSFFNSCLAYFRFGQKYKKTRFIISSVYFVSFFMSNLLFIRLNYAKKLSPVFIRNKGEILKKENEVYKTPYNKDELTFNIEDNEISDLYLK